MLESLDAAAVRRWALVAVEALQAHRVEIDDLNVFPVPDADTGTNLLWTLRAGVEALDAHTAPAESAAAALGTLARGCALAARGNSGVIVSQLLAGLAETVRAAGGHRDCDASLLCKGLATGARRAYAAVAEPVEGTVLSVARAVADALASGTHESLAQVVRRAVDVAEQALARTPHQLAVLAEAGVVDAGGRGLVVLLAALREAVTGEPVPPPYPCSQRAAADPDPRDEPDRFGYEVQFLLEADEPAAGRLRDALADMGDSVVVAAVDAGTWTVHAHVPEPGAAVEAGLAAGRPHRIAVTYLQERRAEPGSPGPAGAPAADRAAPTVVVAVAPGGGLAGLFEAEGARVVAAGGGGVPSPADIVAAAGDAGQVILLPNSPAALAAAAAAAEAARTGERRVAVVPTRSPVQGLAALAVHDPRRRFEDDAVAMTEAAAATRVAEITVAREQSLTSVGVCQGGDVLGLIDGEVVEIGHGLVSVGFALIDRLLGVGAELMTVVVGEGAPPGTGEVLVEHVRDRSPFTEVSVYAGGQPDHPVIIGVE